MASKADHLPLDHVRGAITGLRIPAHPDALREGGESFLTEAFQAFGSLPAGNRVKRITRFEPCPGGSTGKKVFLSVEYERPDPALHSDLFVKLSRDFDDPVRDARGKHEMESEIRFAAVSRMPDFPVTVPIAYFADFDHASHTGLLITQRIFFGANGVEEHHEKCLDHLLDDPLAHYRVIIRALARISAAHRAGRLPSDIDVLFPFDPAIAAAPFAITQDERELQALVARYADFVAQSPQLMPSELATPEFIARLARTSVRFLRHQDAVMRFLQGDPEMIALCHWNANIDNGWFWRDAAGELHCGLMDWGHVNRMNMAFSLWGSLSAAHHDIWDNHLDELVTLFADELHKCGGPRLDVRLLMLHLDLYVAMLAISYFLGSPARILFRLPEAATATGPHDPVFRKSETARNQLHIFTSALKLWHAHDFETSLDRMLVLLDDQPGGPGARPADEARDTHEPGENDGNR